MSRLSAAVEAAERWAVFDPDHRTRGQLDALVDANDPALIDLFGGRLAFGTAGLRAEVGPGPNRMNAVVVRQTTAAVVEWLKSGGSSAPRLLIGYDARTDSAYFAAECARAAMALGARVVLGDRPAATPVVAHQLVIDDYDAGIVVTASHNPPLDNGYKLYLGDGMQIVAPVDDEIAAVIDQVAERWHEHAMAIDDTDSGAAVIASVDEWVRAHRDAALATIDLLDGARAHAAAAHELRVVYTPLHGVGGEPVLAAIEAAGYGPPTVVAEQFSPDPAFPTVDFPNPEEAGALDAAIALAGRSDGDVILANDPDADRLALAVKARSGSQYVALSGDELGVLLGDYVIRHSDGARVVARSIVSSRMLDAIASEAGVEMAVTLTGFKWLARSALSYPIHRWVFGYEEAIGYAIGGHVRDKDGITAVLVALQMLGELRDRDISVWDRLDELAERHGVYASKPFSLRFADDPDRPAMLVEQLASEPPMRLGGVAVVDAGPLGGGELPATPGLVLRCADDAQVIVRPSGTEPKLKVYVEVIERSTPIDQARTVAAKRLADVTSDLRALLESA